MASIRKRGKTFTITVYMGYDKTGKQIKKTTTYHPPEGVTTGKAEKLAYQYAILWEDEIKKLSNLNANKSLEELITWYYQDIAPTILKNNILINTELVIRTKALIINNKNIIETYILPKLGHKKIKEITPTLLDSLFLNLLRGGRTKQTYKLQKGVIIPSGRKSKTNIAKIAYNTGLSRNTITRLIQGKGIRKENAIKIANYLCIPFQKMFITTTECKALSESTVSRIKHCLSAIFTSAVKKEIIYRNPCLNTITLRKKSQTPAVYLDETQALNLINALDNQNDFQFKVQIITLLFTGMRGGELCGLKWKDIDFINCTIHICRTLTYVRNTMNGKKGTYELQSAKTISSDRFIAISPLLLTLLKTHKEKQLERQASSPHIWEHSEMVFTATLGKYYSEHYLNAKFKKFANKIGLPHNIHLHSLRHTTASILINSNISSKLIADQLGHSSTTITHDIYSHIYHKSKICMANILENKLKPQI